MKQILCFGDSNTWGYIPQTGDRLPWGQRWTSILQEHFKSRNIRIIEEGLCGRTTIFEDLHRSGRRGIDVLPVLMESHAPLDMVVIMLGTNDCKTAYHTDQNRIGQGIEELLQVVQKYQPRAKILLISPIYLGNDVWKEGYDPEFDECAVRVSHALKDTYQKIAADYRIDFLAASDYAVPSNVDMEHMDIENHTKLAKAIENKIDGMLSSLSYHWNVMMMSNK